MSHEKALTIFSPEQLNKLVADTLPPASEHRIAVVGTVDRNGTQVVAGFTSESGNWRFEGAYRHEWTGDDSVAGRIMFLK
jgi:hypothetical protein